MILILLLIWLVTGTALAALAVQRQLGSAGLPLAYFLGLTMNHVPGVLLYLDGEELNSGALVTRIGFEQTVIGMVFFLIGVAIARYFLIAPGIPHKGAASPKDFGSQRIAWDQLALICLAIGAAAYFAFIPLLSSIPSASSLLSSLGSLLMVGACLRLWGANEEGGWKFWSTMALLPLFPLTTLLHSGFLGFGVMWTIAVATFLFAQSKRPIGYFLFAPIVFYIGLSVFVTYMAARGEIRQTIWYEQAGIGSRLDRIADTLNGFSWLDLSNLQHREALELRLNQDSLVGMAVARLQSGDVEYASGETLWKMVLSLIPRVVWPDKPAVGGGGTIVRDFTGLEFADGTSVGAGQVLEFYANFGTWGVIGGFLLFGWMIGRMDILVIKYLREGNQRRFLFWSMIGLALLQPGGNLIEIVVSAAGAAIAALGIGFFLRGQIIPKPPGVAVAG